MTKKKVFTYHLVFFLIGALGIGAYFFWKIAALEGAAGLTSIVLLPVAFVFIVAFGIFCGISCAIWTLISFLIRRGKKIPKE